MKRRITVPTLAAVVTLFLCSTATAQQGFGAADADSDGKLTAKEFKSYVSERMPNFKHFKALMQELDKDENGSISKDEFANRRRAMRRVMNNTQPSLKVGEMAPTFKLKSLDGESETDLGQFKGKKPVVLIFGSYT